MERMKPKTICVFCGSGMGYDPLYRSEAALLGRLIALKGYELVYGGSSIGTMRVLADACLEAGGKVTGVMPELLARKEILHKGISNIILCDTMAERKERMGQLSDAFLTLPGGLGTLDELFEALTWVQLSIYRKPVGILNVNGYFDTLLHFLDHTVKEGFVRQEHRKNILVEKTPEKLLSGLELYCPVEAPSKWVDELITDTKMKHK